MSKLRIFNTSLIIVGTSIGAGMLGLPIETGRSGFFSSILFLLITWVIMIKTAFLFIDLFESQNFNFITLSEKILGPFFKAITFIVYILLIGSLTLAYVKGGGIFISEFFKSISTSIGSLVFLLVFVPLIILGPKALSSVNSILTLGIIFSFVVLIVMGINKINPNLLGHVNWKSAIFSCPMFITSFGFHSVLPSLYTYVKKKKELKIAILIGTSITVSIYIFWQLIVIGIVPLNGKNSLIEASNKDLTAISPLKFYLKNPFLHLCTQILYFTTLTTSFLGVGLGLIDFLLDSFNIKPKFTTRLFLGLTIYVPSFLIAQTNLRIFYISLKYGGGIACFYLLIFLPILLSLKNKRKIADKNTCAI